MHGTGGEGDYVIHATDLHRGRAVACAAIAQLAVVVIPPGPDRAVAFQGQAVIVTGGDRDHVTQETGIAAACPPGPDRAIAFQGQAVIVTGGEGDYVTQATDLYLDRGQAVSRAAIAQLAVVVIPPGPDRAVALQCEVVKSTRHHACAGEIGRHGLIGGRHVQGANAVLSGACTRRPADKARSRTRRSDERHRRPRAITACAIRAAIDTGGITGDRIQTVAGLEDVQSRCLDGQGHHPEQYEQIQRPPGPQKQGTFSEGIHVGLLSWRNKTASIVRKPAGPF